MTLTDEQVLEKLKDNFKGFNNKIAIHSQHYVWKHQQVTYDIYYDYGRLNFSILRNGLYSFGVPKFPSLYEKDNNCSLFYAIKNTIEGKTRPQIETLTDKIDSSYLKFQYESKGKPFERELGLEGQLGTIPTLSLNVGKNLSALKYKGFTIMEFTRHPKIWATVSPSIIILEEVCNRLYLKGINIKNL